MADTLRGFTDFDSHRVPQHVMDPQSFVEAERRSGYRICQWAVRDASDAMPLPRERPAEAPAREP